MRKVGIPQFSAATDLVRLTPCGPQFFALNLGSALGLGKLLESQVAIAVAIKSI